MRVPTSALLQEPFNIVSELSQVSILSVFNRVRSLLLRPLSLFNHFPAFNILGDAVLWILLSLWSLLLSHHILGISCNLVVYGLLSRWNHLVHWHPRVIVWVKIWLISKLNRRPLRLHILVSWIMKPLWRETLRW